MPNLVVTSTTDADQQSNISIFHANHWTLILRKLTAREQTPLRQVSGRLRQAVDDADITGSGYGRLLARFKLSFLDKKSQPLNAIMFRVDWIRHFSHKLTPVEVDFFTAVICGDVIIVDQLLKKNPKLILLCDNFRQTALHFAASQGDVRMLDCLYVHIPTVPVDVIDVWRRRVFTKPTHLFNVEKANTPLHCAIRSGNSKAIQWFIQMLQNYIAVNEQCAGLGQDKDSTVEILRCMHGQLAVLPWYLVRHGQNELLIAFLGEACLSLVNQALDTLLHEAASSGNIGLLKRFSENPDYNNQFLRRRNSAGQNVFHCALQNGDPAVINLLLDKDESLLDTLDAAGNTTLHYAVKSRHLAVVKAIAVRAKVYNSTARQAKKAPEASHTGPVMPAFKSPGVEPIPSQGERDVSPPCLKA